MIHKFQMDDVKMVIDVYSGAIHILDDLTYEMVDLFESTSKVDLMSKFSSYSKEEIEEAYEEIAALKQEGLLFTEDPYKRWMPHFKNRNPVVKAMCLHVAHDCNLRCKYCFASEGDYQGTKELMNVDTAKKAIDFLVQNSGNRRNLEVDFFGGEPLMNFNVVKEVVEYGNAIQEKYNKNFRWTLTTNGMLLDEEKKQYINQHMSNVVLSLDGRKEINDMMRSRIDGKGSYERIVPKYQDLAESRKQDRYYVRGTFTRNNLDFAEDVLHLADLGFKQTSVEPVVAPPDKDYALREEDIPGLIAQYEYLAKEYVKRHKAGEGFNFFHFMIDLTQGPCVSKRLAGCGSGSEYVAIVPNGDIYPCHQFVGMEEFKMGSVHEEGLQRKDLQKVFQDINVYSKEDCINCWAKFYCSGGCAANSYLYGGDLNATYEIGCELQRKRVECAMYIQAKLAE